MNLLQMSIKGDYVWGKNGALYHRLLKIQYYADKIWESVANKPVQWLIYPDPTGFGKVIAWTQLENPTHIFIANMDNENAINNFAIPKIKGLDNDNQKLNLSFTTKNQTLNIDNQPFFNGKHYNISELDKGECRVYVV